MDELKEALLKKKFPKTYRHLYKRDKFNMPRSIQLFGLECGDGWYDLIYRLSEKIEEEINKLPEKEQLHCYVVQIKEKYGTLRFYMSCETDEMDKAISLAEAESEVTCEECGKEGKLLSPHGWYSVRCTTCS